MEIPHELIDDYNPNNPQGIDWDLSYALECNNPTFAEADIQRVLAYWEGQNDGDDWRWIISMSDGRYLYLKGWCDYTGWDCQSGITEHFADSPLACLEHESQDDVKVELRRQIDAGKRAKSSWGLKD